MKERKRNMRQAVLRDDAGCVLSSGNGRRDRGGVLESKSPDPHIKSLDGLRGLAAYLVVLSHATAHPKLIFDGIFAGTGSQAVAIFFALSGFLMGYIYFEKEISPRNIIDFYVHRIARVFPLYIFIVLLSYVYFKFRGAHAPLFNVNDNNILSHLTFTYGANVLWTIPTEVQFYAAFPLVWLLARRFGEASAPLFLIAIAAVAWLGFPSSPDIMKGLIFFLSGVCISFVRMKPTRAADVVLTLCLLLILFSTPTGRQVFEMGHIPLRDHAAPIIILPLTVLAAIYSPLAASILGSAVGRYAGTISYSVYLTHVPILIAIKMSGLFEWAPYLSLALLLFATTLVSTATVSLIEKPARKAINRLTPSVLLHSRSRICHIRERAGSGV